MNNPVYHRREQPDEMTPQARDAFRAALSRIIGDLVITIALFILAFQSGAWQLYAAAGTITMTMLLALFGALLIRRSRVEQGAWWVILGLFPGILLSPVFIIGMGLIAGIVVVLLTVTTAAQTLPPKRTSWAIGASVGVGIATLLLDVFGPTTHRLAAPSIFQVIAPIIAGILVLVLGIFAARQFANYSLRVKLIITLLVVIALSLGTTTLFTNRTIQTDLTADVGARLKEIADLQALAIGDLVARQVDLLQAFSLSKVVQDRVETVNASYTGDQAEIDKLDTQWRAAVEANNDADPLVQARLNSEVASELREFRDTFPENVEVFVTDQYGALVAATNRTPDYYQGDKEWWQAAYNKGQGRVYIGQPEFDQSSNVTGLIIAFPLYKHETQEVVGVLRTTILLDGVVQLLNRAKFGQTGDVDLVLPSGQFLRSEGNMVPLDPESQAGLKLLTNQNAAQFNYDNEPRIVSQAPVISSDPEEGEFIAALDWQIAVDADPEEVLHLVVDAQQTTLLTGLGGLVLAGVLTLFVAQLLTGPITRLTGVAQQIAGGDLHAQANIESHDETGQLAQAFNSMTAQLRGLIGSLEDQVRERTAELDLSMEVGQRAIAIRELSELLLTITEFIRQQFNLYYTQVYIVDDLERNLIVKAGTGPVGQELVSRHHNLPIGPGSIVGRVAAEHKSIVVSDTQNSTIHKPNALLPETRSEVAIPLLVQGRIIGVLDMQADKVNTFTEKNLTVFEAMATQLAISIDSAQQWALAQEAQHKVEGAIRQLTRERWTERLASHRENLGFTYDLSAIAPLSMDNVKKANGETESAVPVVIQNESIGQLSVEVPSQRTLSTDEQGLLTAVAQQLAQKVENLRLFEQTQQRAIREQMARQIVDKVRASRDIESALKTAAEELAKNLGVTRAEVDLWVTPSDKLDKSALQSA